jgi:hypothetical protein
LCQDDHTRQEEQENQKTSDAGIQGKPAGEIQSDIWVNCSD